MIATVPNDDTADAARHANDGELASDLCAAKPASGRLDQPPETDEPADAYLARLLDEEHDIDALRFMSMRLGPRAAVWWGALAVWNTLRGQESASAIDSNAAIDAAVRWVIEPTESHRQQAKEAGEAAGVATSAGAVATAAFWSGGSISLPDQPVVPPPAGVCEKLVANAIQMAATPAEPGSLARPFLPALRIGAEVLAGANLWPEEPTTAEVEA